MTHEREDYLKEIFKLSRNNSGGVSQKMLSTTLGISGASVSQMVKKLKGLDYLVDVGTKLQLTTDGEKIAKNIITAHRLWEIFLHDYLGFSWEELDERAERLEHATDTVLLEKLNEFLSHPTRCPHGGTIFLNEDKKRNERFLCEIPQGQKVTISRIMDEKNLLSLLQLKQIHLGDELLIKTVNSFDGSMVVQLQDRLVELSEKVCANIQVI